jgi:ABC-2 type transport system ATP-binding protein
MRQRLGVASVLLKDPELLVLDEPANGLDPQGMNALRMLLRRLGDEGRTVFVSSHLLGEVEQLCDEVAVIDRGRCVAQGRLAHLLRREHRARIRVHGGARTALTVLRAAGIPCEEGPDGTLRVRVDAADAWHITRVLADHGIYVGELDLARETLEDRYLELVTSGCERAALGTWGR